MATFAYLDIHGPVLPFEYAAIVIHSIGLITVAIVIYNKAIAVRKNSTFIQVYTLCLCILGLVAQLAYTLGCYAAPSYGLWAFSNWTEYFTEYFYVIVQFLVIDRVRPKGLTKNTHFMYIAIGGTSAVFIALVVPELLRYVAYDPYSATPDVFLAAWNSYTYFWHLIVAVADFVMNLYLLKQVFDVGTDASDYSRGAFRIKVFFTSLCMLILALDLSAVCIYYFADKGSDEYSVRMSNAKGEMANAAFCFHIAAGLTYLTLVLQIKSKLKDSIKSMKEGESSTSQSTALLWLIGPSTSTNHKKSSASILGKSAPVLSPTPSVHSL